MRELQSKLKEYGLNETEIINQVSQEYNLGFQAVNTKRMRFRERLRLYSEQNKSHDKISINSIYNVIQTLIALYYTDEISISFAPRSIWYDEFADNLENLAKFDNDEMNMAVINYIIQWDRLFFGVGIRQLIGRDEIKNCPMFETIDPMTWIPDPAGRLSTDRFRFMGFEVKASKLDLTKELGYFDIEKLTTSTNSESELTELGYKVPRNMNYTNENLLDNKEFSIYHHYTTINGYKYLVTTGNNRSLIIKLERIIPLGIEQEKNPNLVQFPIVLNYYSPLRFDPFGVCIPDLMEDKQRAKSILFNLNKIKATREALGGDRFFDPKGIRNKADLMQPTIGPKRIPVNTQLLPGNDISRAVYYPPEPRINKDALDYTSVLDNEIQLSLGIDYSTMGIRGDRSITATETQTIQQNANVRLLLGNKINSWGERAFWELWYKAYKTFFSSTDEKFVRVNNGFGIKGLTLKKKDFITDKDPDIVILNKSDKRAMDDQDRANFMAIYPTYIQRQDIPQISKTFASRKMWRLTGLTRDEIMVIEPPVYEELQAKMWCELINNNKRPPAISDLMEDHMTYIIIYMGCDDTPAKWASIEERKQAMIMKMKQEKEQQAMMQGQGMPPSQMGQTNNSENPGLQAFASAGNSALLNNSIQKQSNKVSSTQNVQI